MKKYYAYVGSWEISWNQLTRSDWCPLIAGSVLVAVGLLSLLVFEVVIYIRGL